MTTAAATPASNFEVDDSFFDDLVDEPAIETTPEPAGDTTQDGGFPKGKIACVLRDDITDGQGNVLFSKHGGAYPAEKDADGRVFLTHEVGSVYLNDDQWNEAPELYPLDEDDGPQPGDDLDAQPADPSTAADTAAETAGATAIATTDTAAPAVTSSTTTAAEKPAASNIENYDQERARAAEHVATTALVHAKCVAATKYAKKQFDLAVERLQTIVERDPREMDDDEAADEEAIDDEAPTAEGDPVDDSAPADATTEASDDDTTDDASTDDSEAPAEKLPDGQVRVRLLINIVDEGPPVARSWPADTEVVVTVDRTGTYIPFDHEGCEPNDGTYLNWNEYEVLEDPPATAKPAANKPASEPADDADDPRLDTKLADTTIPKAIVAKLAEEAKIHTIRDLANWSNSGKQLIDIKGIGQGKVEKIDAAMAEFWKANPR